MPTSWGSDSHYRILGMKFLKEFAVVRLGAFRFERLLITSGTPVACRPWIAIEVSIEPSVNPSLMYIKPDR